MYITSGRRAANTTEETVTQKCRVWLANDIVFRSVSVIMVVVGQQKQDNKYCDGEDQGYESRPRPVLCLEAYFIVTIKISSLSK